MINNEPGMIGNEQGMIGNEQGMINNGSTMITVCPDGPLLVRGEFALQTADGQLLPTERSVLALCRCGRSRLKPLCDGSHKSARFADRADADVISTILATAQRPVTDGR